MAVPYSIPDVNVGTDNIVNILPDTAPNLLRADLCRHASINKWGLHRKYVPGTTATDRINAIKGTFGIQGRFRWYYHPQSSPGFDTNELGFTNSAGSLSTDYISLGAYTMAVITGSSWITIKGIGTPNHSYTTDGDGDLTGGSDNIPITYNALIGTIEVTVTANSGDPRTGTIRLTHPDGTADLTISQGGQIFNVDPLNVSFTWDDTSTKRVTIDVGGGYNWLADFVSGQPAWLTVTKSGEGTSSGYVDLSVSKNTGAERSTQMRIRKREGTNVVDTKYVDIYQEQAPL